MRDGHGDDLHRYERIRANFSSNVTSLTDPTSLREYLRGEIDRIGSYPEPTAASLGKSLAKHHGLADGEVLMTSGATEGIYLIAQAYRELVHYYSPDPTFSEYRDAGRLFAREQRELETFEPGQDAPEGVYWLCSPNNPTGQVYSQDFLESLWSRYPQIYFVIDSSYSYFTEAALPDPQETIRHFPNVIFVASLTKRYAMPGLRLGYVMAHSEVIDQLSEYAAPWSVGSLAISAGEWIVRNDFPHLLDRRQLFVESERLWNAIKSLPYFDPQPTDTHFFLVRCTHPAIGSGAELKEILAQRYGLLVRDATNFGYSSPTIRIAAQRPEENDLLIAALTELSSSLKLPL